MLPGPWSGTVRPCCLAKPIGRPARSSCAPSCRTTFELRGQQIADFAGLNARLNEGSVWGGRLLTAGINGAVDRQAAIVHGDIDFTRFKLVANEQIPLARPWP